MKQDALKWVDAEVVLASLPKEIQHELKRRVGQLYLEGRYDKIDVKDC